MNHGPQHWAGQFFDALVLMVAASFLIRFVYEELRPVIPVLVVLLILIGLYRFILRRR